MSLSKKIAARLGKFRNKARLRQSQEKFKRGSKRFDIERLEERQLMAADFLAGEVLVQFEASMTAELRSASRPVGATVLETIHTAMMQRVGAGVIERIQLNSSMTVADGINHFQNKTGVVLAEPNYVLTTAAVSNDTRYVDGSLWGMYSDDLPTAIGPGSTTNQFGSQAEKAWNKNILGSSNVIVGVIDTGIQVNHPDLVNNIWTNPFDPVDGIDNDNNGYTDDTWGWDFAGNDRIVYDSTADDHGTHVAGTIGAEGGNGLGVAGVNWDVTMISLKFLAPTGSLTNAIRAIDYLTDLKIRHGLNIVASNNSWGGGGYNGMLHDAIIRSAKADILFVAAAGNAGANNDVTAAFPSNYNTLTAGSSESPAAFDAVIAVANINASGARSGSSSYGLTTVDLGAPGENILSTTPGSNYGFKTGTSMATPHVAGAVALYKSEYPSASGEDIRRALLQTATPTPSMNGRTVTGGRLNVAAMLDEAPQPTMFITNASDLEGDSGLTPLQFTVSLSKASTEVITVDYRTREDSATAGVDYVTTSGTLTFNPGETQKNITVNVIGDITIEQIERFFVDLSNETNVILDRTFAVGEIISEDLPRVSVADVSIEEGNNGVKALYFTVSLSETHSANISMAYRTLDGTAKSGSDYRGVSGLLVIPAGVQTGTIRIDILGDTIIEDNETFTLKLEAASQATIVDDTAIATIRNDDTEQGISIADGGVMEGNTGRKSMFFSVSLAQPSTSFITIYYATQNGSATTADRDYVAVSGQVSIRPGGRSAVIEVPILGDRKIETDENFFVQLVRAFGAVISDGMAEGIIFNDDAGRFLPPPPPVSGFGAMSDSGNGSSSSAQGFAASSSNSTMLPSTPSGRQVSATGSTLSPPVFGPRRPNSPNMNQALSLGSPFGPRTSDSFASAVDLALIAMLKDNERLLRLR
jgi:subtilisin family serine protease